MVSTADFPQADRLLQVGKVAIAIASGHRADAAIERFIGLDSGGRQGRYYRLAAEILGLIKNWQNRALLTPIGEEYATLSTQRARTDFLARCLVEAPVFREALNYIYRQKPTEEQLRVWFRNYYPGASGTADRRFTTFFNYLRDADLVLYGRTGYQVKKYEAAILKQKTTTVQGLSGKPIVPTAGTPLPSATGSIRYEVDAQKRERANQLHWSLVTAKAAFLNAHGWPAYENEHIDLYARSGKDIVIYEMKSIATTNLVSQVRKAVAQLYEYRYIFTAPSAKLCVVTNAPIQKSDLWLTDYLARDRLIAYEWTEDFVRFHCHDASRGLLEQFAP